MNTLQIYNVDENVASNAWVDHERYLTLYQQSIDNPEAFWREQGKCINWIKPYTQIRDVDFNYDNLHIRWYYDGTLNACANCIDRHLPTRAHQTAIIWEGDNPSDEAYITYQVLYEKVCQFANALKKLGVKKSDVVTIYMPMIPEAAYAMLACARIGAIHSVVFGGFSSEALANRIDNGLSRVVITADESVRGGKRTPLKENVNTAAKLLKETTLDSVIVVKRTGGDIHWEEGRDYWYDDLVNNASLDCPCEEMDAEDPLFILYTSGSTGKPKGVLHTTGGYMVYASLTYRYVFDYHEGDIYWCTADVGWITGHSYVVFGPLANGATTLMFEGTPTYPDASRCWQIVDKYKVNIFYTAPTAIRALMRFGDEPVKKTSRQSLKLLGTVGEPINPNAWEWYYNIVGKQQCPIVDTWWQTETGGILLTPLPGATNLKPGSATLPFFGIEPALVDDKGSILQDTAEGNLVFLNSWPGQMRTVYQHHERFRNTYFSNFKNMFMTGDRARRDEDGYYWITGRVDDVINVSGHRLGTAEIESALVKHEIVAEAAVVGFPHDIKGQGIYAFVILVVGKEGSKALCEELKLMARQEIGPIAVPDIIQFTPGLPKTRSGKIMRRILRKVASGEFDDLGDISTLADPTIVESLTLNRVIK
ncbi:acetate--CoA ligase [Endozoicomonas sp. SM1973]|uniref:Acetyl-coenzyme A synthetase n=1 Tax=Spartinivicinus marinus TaxID=2994442 RepID=A0A853IIS0_9GAMM|nr:acetate--CoA ligase [Spartinivicinus marinus]MCX4029804.1 acetate--CoA ligase [Spartinivicinus marinus]NYZ67526.1 acetate--CoA ligase [Spartinivicinus marinus]